MNKNFKILSSRWFIFGLFILLLNDFILKELYGNWITGKLSDFAGLFIFPLFWSALMPKMKTKIFWMTGITFIFWKSHYSQSLIDDWNSLNLMTISRVVDYSDLIALTILPVAFRFENLKGRALTVKLSPIIPLLLSVFAFLATSRPKQECFNEYDGKYNIAHYSRDSLINDLKQSGLSVNFTKYNNTRYDNEHSEIDNLNDSISNLVLIIGDFNEKNKTVEVSLGCWGMKNMVLRENMSSKELDNEREYIKRIFEELVVEKIEKNVP